MLPHRVAGLFYNRPLLLTPASADTISNYLLARAGSPLAGAAFAGADHDAGETKTLFRGQERADGTVEVHTPRASRFYGETPLSEDGTRRPLPFRRTAEGVAILTLVGEWVNRGGYVGAYSGVISYEGFKYQLEQVRRDSRTKAVLLDMESPGGEAVGAFEAAAAVRALSAEKPVWALVNGQCCSAMYAIASGASRIVSIPTGMSGSIGVVLAHFDLSEYLKKEGIKPTFIHAGARKVEGNPYQALPEPVRNRLQAEVESFYDLFVQTVAAGRSGLTEKQIRDTEAGVFMGAEALELGLVDELMTFEQALAALGAGRAHSAVRPAPAPGQQAAAPSPVPAASSAASPQNTRSCNVTDAEADQVRAEERARFNAILNAPEARGREEQAREIAFNTALSPESALAILRLSPLSGSDLAAFVAEKEGRKPLALDVETGPSASADGAVPWDDIAAKLNAELPAAPGSTR